MEIFSFVANLIIDVKHRLNLDSKWLILSQQNEVAKQKKNPQNGACSEGVFKGQTLCAANNSSKKRTELNRTVDWM